MLAQAAHVPHMLIGSVRGAGGTWAGVDLPDDLLDLVTLWSASPRGMAGAQFDLAGVIRLRELRATRVLPNGLRQSEKFPTFLQAY